MGSKEAFKLMPQARAIACQKKIFWGYWQMLIEEF